ncbi:hypothetical protein DES44_4057 [Roseateles depolymerans]|uniref:Uncharacterized protein n=2 Tax=Roseateles depolymerans TaxID=76731 RepID=A0A0U3LDG3_9BURK|nr:hypothetical protein RD2015_7 [Roseateles depolymerans]REG14045.1 hypothetical protein DES44_4057 [Roseateles depolymerans]
MTAQRRTIAALFGPSPGNPRGPVVVQRVSFSAQLLPHYGAIQGKETAVDGLAAGALQVMIDRAGDLAPLVGSWPQFMQLYSYLNCAWGNPDDYDTRASVLIDYNRLFAIQSRRPDIQADKFDDLRALLTDMALLPVLDLAAVRTAAAGTLLSLLAPATNRRTVLDMIAANRQTAGVPGLVSAATVPKLEPIFEAYPPGGFNGIAAWGDGNHDSPDENAQEHFLKHICYDFPVGNVAPPPGEAAFWWNAIGFTPSLQYVLPFTYSMPTALHQGLQQEFGANYDTAPAGHVFDPNNAVQLGLFGNLTNTFPGLAADILNRYYDTYMQDAIHRSTVMTSTQVHLSQDDYFISGVDGNVYVVARIEGAVAGISSMYWTPAPATKVVKASQGRVWRL